MRVFWVCCCDEERKVYVRTQKKVIFVVFVIHCTLHALSYFHPRSFWHHAGTPILHLTEPMTAEINYERSAAFRANAASSATCLRPESWQFNSYA